MPVGGHPKTDRQTNRQTHTHTHTSDLWSDGTSYIQIKVYLEISPVPVTSYIQIEVYISSDRCR